MRSSVKGPARYLIAAIIFGIGSVGLSMNFMQPKLRPMLAFPLGMLLFSMMMFWFYRRAKAGEEPLKKYKLLMPGFLFTWLGAAFMGAAFVVPASERGRVVIPAVICLLLGIIILILALRNRLRADDSETAAKADKNSGAWIGILAASIVLVPMFLMGLLAIFKGKIVGGIIICAVPLLFLGIFLVVRRFGAKLKMKKEF